MKRWLRGCVYIAACLFGVLPLHASAQIHLPSKDDLADFVKKPDLIPVPLPGKKSPNPVILPPALDDLKPEKILRLPSPIPPVVPRPANPSPIIDGDTIQILVDRDSILKQVPQDGKPLKPGSGSPTGLKTPPLASGKDRVATLESSSRCDEALKAFAPYQSNAAISPDQATIVGTFVRDCYDPFKPIPQDLADAQARVVVLALKASPDDPRKCTGFLLDDHTILTAAHCFSALNADKMVSRPNCGGMIAISFDPVQVRTFQAQLSLPHIRDRLVSLQCPSCATPHFDDDVWAYTPHDEHECDSCGVKFASPTRMKKTISNPVQAQLEDLARMSGRDRQDPRPPLRIESI